MWPSKKKGLRVFVLLVLLLDAGGAAAENMTGREISYGPAETQKLDLYLPAAVGKPLVIYIHGGAWISGDKESYQKLGQLFVGHGLAMAVVNYRLAVAPAPARFPEPARDVAAALTLLKKEASSLGFDGGKVFLIGHSAGAHIAATLALAPEFDSVSPQVSGYIGIEGIYDIPALVRRWPTYRDWFIDLAFGSNPGLWKQASPQYWRGKTVRPWLLIHSTKDELVDMGQSEGFFHHLHRLKVPATLDKSSQQSHFGVIEALGKPGDPILKKILAFIDEH